MADDKQSGPGLGGNSIILLVAAATSAVYMGWRSPPLFSTRPTEPGYEISQTKSIQDIDARLWQDPFAAVERGLEDKGNGNLDLEERHCLSDFHDVLNRKDPSGRPKHTLLIGADLPGDPYPEAAETRRRLRYAVLSALHVAKYVPVDDRHIGYSWTPKPPPAPKPETAVSGLFRVAKTAGSDSPAEGSFNVTTNGEAKCGEVVDDDKLLSMPAIVPFEQYEDMNRNNRVIVLWLDEEALAHRGKPITSLAGLLCKLDLDDNDESFVFLGPQDSDVLQRMVQEIKDDKDHQLLNCEVPKGELSGSVSNLIKAGADKTTKTPRRKPIARLPIYNYGATAENRIILKRAGDREKTDIKSLFLDGNIPYYRTISSDEELAEVLAEELGRRGIELCPKQISHDPVPPPGSACRRPHRDRVFLLSEWDTAYGRYLPKSVSETFGADESSFGGCRLDTSHGIMHASYLRGLDGRLPSRRPAKGAQRSGGQNGGRTPGESGEQTDGGEASATPETASRFESAEGQSQFDYLRRLTEALKECDKKLRLEGAGKIQAIGVLGSDVYDKLLLLQALRPEFPEATFFTTDLDELLLPQEKLRYTRDLLVASGHGLTLIPELQKDILPFRSSYQTSIFLAATLAIRNSSHPAPKTDAKIDPWPEITAALGCWSKPPLLFQIGRTAAQRLPTGPVGGADEGCKARDGRATADFVKYASIDPHVAKLYPEFTPGARFGIFLIPIALFGALLSLPSVRRVCFPKIAATDAWGRMEASGQARTSGQTKIQPGLKWVIPLLVAALVAWAIITLFWWKTAPWLTEYGNGDPMQLFEGISIWPTIALRVFGGMLSLFLIWWTLRSLEINKYETAKEMGFRVSKAEAFKDVWNSPALPSLRDKILSLLWFPPLTSDHNPLGYDDSGRPKEQFVEIVREFPLKWEIRCLRALVGTLLMMAVWFLILVPVFGDLTAPARGQRAQVIYCFATLFDVMPTLFLTFLVVDATLLSRKFISRLTQIGTVWLRRSRWFGQLPGRIS
jgi:hypothetical protein